jgi:hypothetical protein
MAPKQSDLTPTEVLVQLGAVANGGGTVAANVPCGACNACCWYGRTDVDLRKEKPEDIVHLELFEDEHGGYYLAHREDGACFHLDADGRCTVWEHRPEVCRSYDCRAFGLAGLAPSSGQGQRMPAWRFPLRTPLDRAILLAAQVAAAPYVQAHFNGTAMPDGNMLANVLKGIYENLPQARAMVAAEDQQRGRMVNA